MTSPIESPLEQSPDPLTETPWLPAFLSFQAGQWHLRFEGEDYTWPGDDAAPKGGQA